MADSSDTTTTLKARLPEYHVYANYQNGNYGVNALCFSVGGRDFYFSYKTLVAFRCRSGDLVVHQNDWGSTTGKHLNAIDGGAKNRRVPAATFANAFAEEMSRG